MPDSKPKASASSGRHGALSIILLAVCLLLLLSLVSYDWRDIPWLCTPVNEPPYNFVGNFGAWIAFLLFLTLGVGAYLLPLWLLGLGIVLVFRGVEHVKAKLVWAVLMTFSMACLLELDPALTAPLTDALNISAPGGLPAQVVTGWISDWMLGRIGTFIALLAALLASTVLFFGWDAIVRELSRIGGLAGGLAARMQSVKSDAGDREAVDWPRKKPAIKEWKRDRIERVAKQEDGKTGEEEEPLQRELIEVVPPAPRATPKKAPEPEPEPAPQPEPEPEPEPAKPQKPPAPKPREKPPVRPPADAPRQVPGSAYQLPPLSLLADVPPAEQRTVRGDTDTTGRVIVETLNDFGIKVELRTIEGGPTVTRYELVPAPGVKVEKIASLQNNLALSLKATSVRVQAPIPGKGTVGIEVPNTSSSMVYLREILEGPAWRPDKMQIPIALGKDVAGKDMVADLATMPHMLIAGATGSGKTVCMNTILAGLLMSRTPEQLQLMLIDPKIVEFAVYNQLPHLLGARNMVITDPKKVAGGLRWAITEMERRYKIMARAGVRNIQSYNARPVAKQQSLFGEGEEASPLPDRLPYIVIIVDELADLMMTAQAEIENYIARLAQLSRAVGIHMILATQRPSVDVITGTIKANFPARIAFQVAQKNDSRTILDAVGADKLLGRGDMLFLPPGASKLIRSQGALTSDEEIRRIVDFIRKQVPPPPAEESEPDETAAADTPAPEAAKPAPAAGLPDRANFDDMLESGGTGGEDEELLEQSVQIIRETRRASTSSLQRRLRIGYTRAARIMDVLEERGIVGPARGSDPREILIDLDGDVPAGNPNSGKEE
jgi:S-DNA-T family DNA segregation ATPase FtsK/SpoIIIE